MTGIAAKRWPPHLAWTDVWIAPWADGYLQANARTRRGRWLSRTERTVMRGLREWVDT